MHAVGVAMLVTLVLVTMIAVALLFKAFLKESDPSPTASSARAHRSSKPAPAKVEHGVASRAGDDRQRPGDRP
jgi:hypothetical protein